MHWQQILEVFVAWSCSLLAPGLWESPFIHVPPLEECPQGGWGCYCKLVVVCMRQKGPSSPQSKTSNKAFSSELLQQRPNLSQKSAFSSEFTAWNGLQSAWSEPTDSPKRWFASSQEKQRICQMGPTLRAHGSLRVTPLWPWDIRCPPLTPPPSWPWEVRRTPPNPSPQEAHKGSFQWSCLLVQLFSSLFRIMMPAPPLKVCWFSLWAWCPKEDPQ